MVCILSKTIKDTLCPITITLKTHNHASAPVDTHIIAIPHVLYTYVLVSDEGSVSRQPTVTTSHWSIYCRVSLVPRNGLIHSLSPTPFSGVDVVTGGGRG